MNTKLAQEKALELIGELSEELTAASAQTHLDAILGDESALRGLIKILLAADCAHLATTGDRATHFLDSVCEISYQYYLKQP